MANKYLALQKDVFDINKITVVGNPSISTDGVASLITGTALYADVSIANATNTVIEFDYVYKKNTSAVQLLWIAYPSQNDHTELYWTYISTDGKVVSNNTLSTKVLTENVKYHFTIKTDFATYNETYVDGVLWCRNTSTHTQNVGQIYIANRYDKFRPVVSPFDLKTFKIYVDNQLIYSPTKPTYLLERRKEGYDPSKFTVVGTPTITDDGVASGFSGNNYIKTPVINQGNNLDVFVRFNADSFSSMPQIMASKDIQGIALIFTTNNKIGMSLGNGSAWVAQVMGTTTLSIDNDYYAHFLYKDGYYRLFLSEDKINWSKECEYASAINFLPSTAFIIGAGRLPNNANSFTGSIELPSVSITVDGKEVFTGAKENFYMLRFLKTRRTKNDI